MKVIAIVIPQPDWLRHPDALLICRNGQLACSLGADYMFAMNCPYGKPGDQVTLFNADFVITSIVVDWVNNSLAWGVKLDPAIRSNAISPR